MVKSCVYFGSVMHMRLKPRRHLFRYNVFSLFLDIDKLAEFDKTSWFFRLNRWGMVSLYEKDHGDRNSLRLRDWVCLLYTSPSPRDEKVSRMPSSA